MPSLKVIIIANACAWNSWPDKIAAIKAFYAPLIELDIDIKYTDFTNIPLASYPGTVTQFGPNGATDIQGTDLEIDQTWFNENIGSIITGYDIAVFQAANVSADGLPLGIKFEKLNGTWCCETFVQGENDIYVLPPLPGQISGINLGNESEVIIEHEISHALYSIASETDNTHLYFYANNFSRVLTDIKLPNQSLLVSLYQQAIALLEEELGLLKASQSTADMNTPQTQKTAPGATPSTNAPTVSQLANFIRQYEGWSGPSAKYPNGTIAYQCNNPENAKWDGQANAKPRTFVINGVEEIFADFDTYEHGWAYMIDCLTSVINGTSSVYNEAAAKLAIANASDLTLDQFFTIRDPAADSNSPLVYAGAAGKEFGVNPATFQMKQFSLS